MKASLLALAALMIAACSMAPTQPSPPAQNIFAATRASGLGYECSGTECSCDLTAPFDSTRTCAGFKEACLRLPGATVLTCSLKGKMTCTCK